MGNDLAILATLLDGRTSVDLAMAAQWVLKPRRITSRLLRASGWTCAQTRHRPTGRAAIYVSAGLQ